MHAEPAAATSHARLAQKEALGLAWGNTHDGNRPDGDRHDRSAEGMVTSTATTTTGAATASAAQPVIRHHLCVTVGEYEGAETLKSLCPSVYSTDSQCPSMSSRGHL